MPLFMHLAMIISVHFCRTPLSKQKACVKLFSIHEKFSFFPTSAYVIGDYSKISRCLIKAEAIMRCSAPCVKGLIFIWKRNLNALEQSFVSCLLYYQGFLLIDAVTISACCGCNYWCLPLKQMQCASWITTYIWMLLKQHNGVLNFLTLLIQLIMFLLVNGLRAYVRDYIIENLGLCIYVCYARFSRETTQ